MGGDSVMGVNNKACWTVRALFAASEEYLGFGFPTPLPILYETSSCVTVNLGDV